MDEKIMNEVFKRIDVLGQQISTGAVKLGEEAIKHTWALNLGRLTLTLFFSILSTILLIIAIRCGLATTPNEWSEGSFRAFVCMACGVVGVIMAFITVLNLASNGPTYLANLISPTWAVVRSLIVK